LDSRSETESVASSIQEETYQMIKKKYAMMGASLSQDDIIRHSDAVLAKEIVINYEQEPA